MPPDPSRDADWAFPDSGEGIDVLLGRGACVVWANTTLFRSHPLTRVRARGDLSAVGQPAGVVELWENKRACHQACLAAAIPVPAQAVVEAGVTPAQVAAAREHAGLSLPLVVKPVRGRGSEGVRLTGSDGQAAEHVAALAAASAVDAGGKERPRFGQRFLIEEYLPGAEWTISVMPPGRYRIRGRDLDVGTPWALPPIARTGHSEGIMPYSGTMPVVVNSHADPDLAPLRDVLARCEELAALVRITAPIRVDCRRDARDGIRLFDVNLKPNMTGPGRPGRDGMRNLCGLAAEEIGWSYSDLLASMAANATALETLAR
jgi:hypothetical protein